MGGWQDLTKDNGSKTGVNMCGIIFSYTRYSLLKSDTIYSEVVMDVVSRFQATIIYSSAPKMAQPFYDFHKSTR
jgi:hypothetical protein